MPVVTKLIALLMITACAAFGPRSNAQSLELQEVARDLSQATTIATANDGSDRLFVVLQRGQVRVIQDGILLDEPFLEVSGLVSCCGERGLLGLAFHPDYPENGLFFINYTNLQGDTVVARYQVSDDPNRADAGSSMTVLTVQQPFANHNGGQIKFGPDGYLYIGMGDGGSGGDPRNDAQNLSTLLGTMLRLDIDSAEPYAVPADNPFVGVEDARDEIWAYGLRNPWRFSFDRETGDLFIADVGQSALEEINFQPATSAGGENYGWRLMEGSACFNPRENCNDGTLVLPILEYSHAQGCSVTGGFRYRGSEIPGLAGTYLFSDYCSGRLWGATQDEAGAWSSVEIMQTGLRVSTFGEDERGELYLADYASGTLYRIVGR